MAGKGIFSPSLDIKEWLSDSGRIEGWFDQSFVDNVNTARIVAFGSTAGHNTLSFTPAVKPTVGNVLLVAIACNTDNGTTPTLSDNQGGANTWTLAGTIGDTPTVSNSLSLYYVKINQATGTYTINASISFTISAVASLTYYELTNVDAAIIDVAATTNYVGTPTTTIGFPAVTTVSTNDLVVGFGFSSSGSVHNFTPSAGWNIGPYWDNSISSWGAQVSAWAIESSTGAFTPAVTSSISARWYGITIAIKNTVSVPANVNASNISSTASLNSVTTSGNANNNITGLSSTGAIHSATESGTGNITLTGLSSTSALNNITVSGDGTNSVTGLSSTSGLNSVVLTADGNYTLTGLAATLTLNSVTAAGTNPDANVNATNISLTSALNSVTVNGTANYTPTTLALIGAINNVTPSVSVSTNASNIAGTFGLHNVTPSGNGNYNEVSISATLVLNSVTAGVSSFATPSGISSTSALHGVTSSGDANVNTSNIAATSTINNVVAGTVVNINVTSVSATSAIHSVTANGTSNVNVSNISANFTLNSPSESVIENYFATGTNATFTVNNVVAGISVNANASNISSIGNVHSVITSGNANYNATNLGLTSNLHSVTPSADASIVVSHIGLSTSLNSPSIVADGNIVVSGNFANTVVNSATVFAGQNAIVNVTGVSGNIEVGIVSPVVIADYLPTFLVETNKLSPDAYIELVDFDASNLRTAGNQPGQIYRFTNTSNSLAPLYWRGNAYYPFPFEITGVDKKADGTALAKPQIVVSNTPDDTGTRFLLAAVLTLGDLRGMVVTRWKTYYRFLDGQINENSLMCVSETWVITRKVAHIDNTISWEMSSTLDRPGLKLPRKQILRDGGFPGVSKVRNR